MGGIGGGVRGLLHRAGFRIRFPSTLARALACLGRLKFDVVFLDLNSPGLSSKEMFVKVAGAYGSTPVVALTAVPDPQVHMGLLAAGAAAFSPKGDRALEMLRAELLPTLGRENKTVPIIFARRGTKMRRVGSILVGVILVVVLGSQARGQVKYDMERFEAAVGLTTLKEHGFGLAARVLGPVGFEVSAGYEPWLAMVTGACEVFDVMMKLQLEGDLLIRLNIFGGDDMKMVIKLGGGWMEDIDYFAKAGVGLDSYVSRNFFFEFSTGLMIVPGAEAFMDHFIDAQEECRGASGAVEKTIFSSDYQPYLGLNLFLRF